MKTFKTTVKSIITANTWLVLTATIGILTLCFNEKVMAQHTDQMVRIAKIEVDPAQLDKYNAALKEQMAAAVHAEPGVLTYYAVADKANPAHITILEIYADTAAYQAHIQTAHFKKYKATVEHMVTKLELEDVKLIAVAKQPGM